MEVPPRNYGSLTPEERLKIDIEMRNGKSVNETLTQRNSTHGNFEDNGRIMQGLKATMHYFYRTDNVQPWTDLEPYQREALDMIMHKVGRILCGDPNFADHWHDIAGYAKLCEDRCAK